MSRLFYIVCSVVLSFCILGSIVQAQQPKRTSQDTSQGIEKAVNLNPRITQNSGFSGVLPGDEPDKPAQNSKKPEFTSAELEKFITTLKAKEEAKLKADSVIEEANKKIQAAIKQAELDAAPSLEIFHKTEADFNVIYWEYIKVHSVDYRKWILQLDENKKPIWVDADTLPKADPTKSK